MSDTPFIIPTPKQLASKDAAATLAELAPADTTVLRPLAAEVGGREAVERTDRLE